MLDFLQTQDSYNKHKRVLHKFKRRQVTSPCLNNLFQADLIILDKYSKFNKGYKNLLTVIDVLSRYAFKIPLKSKSGTEVAEALRKKFHNVNVNIHKRMMVRSSKTSMLINI